MTVHVTSKVDLELGELQTAHAKLNDMYDLKVRECAEVRMDLVRWKEKARKKSVPYDLQTDDGSIGTSLESSPEASLPSNTAVLGTPALQPPHPTTTHPSFILNQVHIRGHANVDLGHDPTLEPAVEAVIQQAVQCMRTMADMARDSARHKGAAHEAWAHVRALQNYTGYQMPTYQMH